MATGTGRWLRRAGATALTAVSGAIAYGRFAAPRSLPLPNALAGERRTVSGRAGPLNYYVSGSGQPLLLVHSINAAASAYEVKPIHDAIADRRVYALDLPGFGFSDRSPGRYRVRLYVDAIHDMLDEIAAGHGEPVDILALSLSCEFVARAAVERPEAVRSLALLTPTGFTRLSAKRRGPEGSTVEVPLLHAILSLPVWSRGLYNLLVTRRSIRFFLERTWGSKRIDEGLLDYDYLTSHQPGARHAPYAFVSGRLFSRDIRTVYERLTAPILVLHGTRGDFADFSGAGWAKRRPNWRFIAMATGALPHFERLTEVMALYRPFLERPSGPGMDQGSSSAERSPSP